MTQSLYDILLDVSKSATIDAGDLDSTGQLILTSVIHGLQISRAGIWLLDEEKKSILGKMLIDGSNNISNSELQLFRHDFPRYFASLDTERAIAANNARTDLSTSEFCDSYLIPFGITSMLDAPIRHRGKMLGIICCEHQGEARQWSNEEIAFVSALADTYGRSISAAQRNDYEQQLKESNEKLEIKVNERTHILQDALRNLQHAQTKLIENEKMASIGRLVSGLAHEINTPLGIAVTSASHCSSELNRVQTRYQSQDLDEVQFAQFLQELNNGLGLINVNLQRAATLVQNFKLSGSIYSSNEEERFCLSECIQLTLKSLKPLLEKHKIECTLDADDSINLFSDHSAIAQIITNLITNSIHHAFSNTDIKKISIKTTRTDTHALLHYHDNGCGISDAVRQKIFEPFFTTARSTGGSGLGMSIVYNLITQKLKGDIQIASPHQGAYFIINIPLA